MSHVLGLDVSLTRTGYAVANAPVDELVLSEHLVAIGVIATSPTKPDSSRLAFLREELRALLLPLDVELALVESPWTGGSGSAWKAAAAFGVVLEVLAAEDVPIGTLAPNSLKKYATDNGNATKAQMIAAAELLLPSSWGESYSLYDDEADALHLATVAGDTVAGLELAGVKLEAPLV